MPTICKVDAINVMRMPNGYGQWIWAVMFDKVNNMRIHHTTVAHVDNEAEANRLADQLKALLHVND